MTNTNTPAREIATDLLDQVVGGASVVVHDARRRQEQGDKLNREWEGKAA